MSYIDESQAKGLVKRIFRSLYAAQDKFYVHRLDSSQRKICKKIKRECQDKPSSVFIAERFENTNKWQVIWGEWCLFSTSVDVFSVCNDIEKYDKIAFDLTINVKGKFSFKNFYVVLSKHALKRLIMRSKESLKNSHDLNLFLKKLTKKLVFSAVELSDQFIKNKGEPVSGYTVIDGVFLPLAFEMGINKSGKLAATCTIKTFMPAHYEGAVAELKKKSPIKYKENFFDYESNFIILDT